MNLKTIPFSKFFNHQTGKTVSVTDDESIKTCLSMLLSTCKGELLGDADFGCNLKKYIINYKNPAVFSLIKSDIVESIKKYEKRVYVTENTIQIHTSKSNPNLIYINIFYTDKTNGTKSSLSFTVNGEDVINES